MKSDIPNLAHFYNLSLPTSAWSVLIKGIERAQSGKISTENDPHTAFLRDTSSQLPMAAAATDCGQIMNYVFLL